MSLSVPELAVVGEGDSRFVYTIAADGTAKRIPVRTGVRSEGRVEILQGLRPGQKVVTEGVVKLSDGMKVRLAGADNAQAGQARGQGQLGRADATLRHSRSNVRSSRRSSRSCWRWSGWSASSACRCANIPMSIRRSCRSKPNIPAPRRASSKAASPRCSRNGLPASRGCRRSRRARRTAARTSRSSSRRAATSTPPPTTSATGSAARRRSCPRRRSRRRSARSMPMRRRSCSWSSPRPGWSRLELSDYVDRNIVDRFSSLDGVARVFIGGEARPAMRVWLQPERLAAFQLTPADVETALRTPECRAAGRTARIRRPEHHLARRAPVQDAAGIRPAGRRPRRRRLSGAAGRRRAGRAGAGKSLFGVPRSTARPAIGLGIVRQSGANTLAVATVGQGHGRAGPPDPARGHDGHGRFGRSRCSSAARSTRSGRRSPRRRCWWCSSSSCSSAAGARP